MILAFRLLCFLYIFQNDVKGSPFELLDNYIENFENQLNHMRGYLNSNVNIHTKNVNVLHSEIENDIKDIGQYDFIVIGGGTSGSVIASRLSEVPEWKVLLLEAGDVESTATKVPCMHSCLKSPGSPLTWGYYSTPQSHACLDREERRCFIPTAKSIGGTTAINDMLYIRGNARDFDIWADTGLIGWCFSSLNPYFKKIEDAHLDTMLDDACHRYGGPVHLESPRYHSHIAQTLLDSATEIQLNEIDLNGKHPLGIGVPQLMTKNGQRYSAAEAYLKPAVKRKNLEIKPLSEVTKILISEHTKEARGVKFLHDGQLFTASATKEIILASGTINTAKILLLSGIGPEEDLKHLNIEPRADLKVGSNLIHHVMFPGFKYVLNDTYSNEPPFYYSKEIDYLRNGKGPLASTGVELVGFIKTDRSKGRHLYPDVELLVTSNQNEHKAPSLNLRLENESTEYGHELNQKELKVNLILLHPNSRGTIKLQSNHPTDHPLIDLNDFSDKHENDIETLISAIRTSQKLLHSHSFQKLGSHLYQEVVPNCTAFEVNSDEYWKCAIRHLTISTGEVTGSAPMGTEKGGEFGDSVVDLKLRVHGIEKLRVADDSVIPVSISGHLAALKMVIGEKCAEFIKEEWIV